MSRTIMYRNSLIPWGLYKCKYIPSGTRKTYHYIWCIFAGIALLSCHVYMCSFIECVMMCIQLNWVANIFIKEIRMQNSTVPLSKTTLKYSQAIPHSAKNHIRFNRNVRFGVYHVICPPQTNRIMLCTRGIVKAPVRVYAAKQQFKSAAEVSNYLCVS